MTKHVAITDAEAHLKDLVAEVESTGDEIVLTRDGAPVARLLRAEQQGRSAEVSPEQIERRRAAASKLQEIARQLNIGATHDEIKQWINEGHR
ncbi:type II toxin-antitoxin system Phd/YefM family antitoxin [Bradyrhizobium sp.]|jgi:prevent-host-death family protein|uniref:type II toxin-antitoxin system Phd/YefM family antitoxin n=1 Tax=Bradyrhizobium sp. TaxID=376 RepID=UPI002DFB0DB0|nr:type II toxin-antitoxin system Phd/YefM family antitoxin [Bradyrhizobium sp.]